MEIGLEGAAIAFGLRVRNTGRIALPFGLGFHPYFPRDAGTNLRLPAATVFPIDRDGLPLPERAPGEDEDFRTERSVGLRALSGIYPAAGPVDIGQNTFGSRLSFIGAEFLQIWAPAEAPYFCVEPVSHSIDSFADPAGSSRYGLEPGERREMQVRIEPWETRPAEAPESHGEAKSPACQTYEEDNGS